MKLIAPFPREHLEKLWEWLQYFRNETIDSRSPQSLDELVEKYDRDLVNGMLIYAVMDDEDEPHGAIWIENAGDGIGIGHLVFDRYSLTPSEKMRFVRQALDMMFESGFRKVIWIFFADNRAFRVFLKRMGAEHEGVFRKQVSRDGQWVDARFMASFPPEAA